MTPEEPWSRPRDRAARTREIIDFVRRHPGSYASLAICRRSLDSGIESVTPAMVDHLGSRLRFAPDEEIAAYWDIVT